MNSVAKFSVVSAYLVRNTSAQILYIGFVQETNSKNSKIYLYMYVTIEDFGVWNIVLFS